MRRLSCGIILVPWCWCFPHASIDATKVSDTGPQEQYPHLRGNELRICLSLCFCSWFGIFLVRRLPKGSYQVLSMVLIRSYHIKALHYCYRNMHYELPMIHGSSSTYQIRNYSRACACGKILLDEGLPGPYKTYMLGAPFYDFLI